MLILSLVLLLVVIVFALENRTPITVQFLGWHYDTQLGVALIAAAVVGAIVIYISGLFEHRKLRAQTRSAEARLREAERQQQAGTHETSPPPRL